MKQALLLVLILLAGCASQPGARPGDGGSVGSDGRPLGTANSGALIHTQLGAGYYARGQYAVALEELRKALEVDASYPPAYNVLALVHADLREDKQAEQHFRRALDLSPQYAEANNNFGLFLCQRKRIPEAIERFEQALANPLYATPESALANAGACSLEQGDIARSEQYYQRALKRVPTMASAMLGMAEVHYRQGRWLAARGLLRKLTEVSEVSAQALWLGVRVERSAGDREAEASYGAQLRRRYPDAMQTQWLLTGQYDQAGSLL